MKNNKFILIFASIIIIIYGISKAFNVYITSLDYDFFVVLHLLYFFILGPIIFYRYITKGKRLESIEALKVSLLWGVLIQIILALLSEISIILFLIFGLISYGILVTGEDDNTDKDKLIYHKIILFYIIPILFLENGFLFYNIRFILYLHSLNYVTLFFDLLVSIFSFAIIISSIKLKKFAWWLTIFLMLIIGLNSILTFIKNGNSIILVDIPFYFFRVMLVKLIFSIITIFYYIKVKHTLIGVKDVMNQVQK